MNFIINNWYIIVALLAVGVFIGYNIACFLKLPDQDQEEKIVQWLRYFVTKAEEELGSGTGQLKLATVWAWFTDKMPWVAKMITFTQFEAYVKTALNWMEHQKQTNPKIKERLKDSATDN